MVWTVPIIIIAILAVITWRSTHELEPSVPLQSDVDPITIEVVSLDWKWLFIYPEQKIATVNYVAFPKDVPVTFKVTSDNIMNSFFIPRLGSQIYAMPGMVTRLHLIANHEGEYKGISSSYSGEGFSHMKFKANALPDQQSFDQWVASVKQKPLTLNGFEDYQTLAQPSEDVPVTYYSQIPHDLFESVVMQHMGSLNMSDEGEEHGHMDMAEHKG